MGSLVSSWAAAVTTGWDWPVRRVEDSVGTYLHRLEVKLFSLIEHDGLWILVHHLSHVTQDVLLGDDAQETPEHKDRGRQTLTSSVRLTSSVSAQRPAMLICLQKCSCQSRTCSKRLKISFMSQFVFWFSTVDLKSIKFRTQRDIHE